jgi:hypothetical protein
MIRRRSLLHSALLLVLTFSLNPLRVAAQEGDEFAQGPDGGAKLAERMRTLQPEENAKWRGTFKILHRKQKFPPISVSCETASTPTNWSVFYVADATAASGAEKVTVIHSTNGPNQYAYACASSPGASLGEPRQLAGTAADVPLAGTDFWLSDLGFEFYHWPEQRLLKGEMRSGKPCYVLESVNPGAPPTGYGRVLSWIEKEHVAPLMIEAYRADNTNKLFKEFALGSFKKNKDTGRYQLKDLQIDNDRTGSTTLLEFDLETK